MPDTVETETAPEPVKKRRFEPGPPAAPEEKYPLPELMARAPEIFGVASHVVAGAMHGREGTAFTIAEVKKAIADFRKRKVR